MRLCILDRLVLLSLNEIDIGDIIRYNLLIGRRILHYPESLQRVVILALVEADKTVIVVGVDIVGILGYLPDGIEQRQGIIELLQRKIAIPFMEFKIGDLLIAQIIDIRLLV